MLFLLFLLFLLFFRRAGVGVFLGYEKNKFNVVKKCLICLFDNDINFIFAQFNCGVLIGIKLIDVDCKNLR